MKSRRVSYVTMVILAAGGPALWPPPQASAQCEITPIVVTDDDDLVAGSRFGWSSDISGDYAIVGAYQANETQIIGENPVSLPATGAAYIFKRTGLSWNKVARLGPTTGVPPIVFSLLGIDDDYGYSVAIDGRIAVVGARLHDVFGMADRGAAYVFRRSNAGEWLYVIELTAVDGREGDWFGHAVAIDGDWIVVGTPQDDDAGTANGGNSGSAYVFHFDGSEWSQAIKLTASDDAIGDYFGDSVAVSGNWIAIGASRDDDACGQPQDPGCNSGSVYMFYHDPTADPFDWQFKDKLTAQSVGGVADDESQDGFGSALSMSGDRVVVGAWGNDDAGSNSGSAYVYRLEGAADWVIEQKLVASDAAAGDSFARLGVAIGDVEVVIGAHKGDVDDPAIIDAGTAYVYRRSGVTWSEQVELAASDAAAGARFGQSASISGDYAIVGAYAAGGTGAAYIFAIGNANDCNENGENDDCEIVADPGADTNSNGVLDVCECTGDEDCVGALTCISGTCNQSTLLCDFTVNPGFCAIDGVCYDNGAGNPANECEFCDASSQATQEVWSNRVADFACGDPADSTCDHPDTCDGNGVCQTNPEPAGTECADEGEACTIDECDGNGACAHSPVPDNVQCQIDANDCTDDVCRSGVCTAVNKAAGASCGDPTNTTCNPADTCDGNGLCLDNIVADGTLCATDGQFCTGVENCQAGECISPGDPCTAPGLICDAPAEDRNQCSCDPAVQDVCDDGVFCNGAEECVNGQCNDPGDPCIGLGLLCDEAGTRCVECLDVADCDDDGNECTDTVCNDGTCGHEPVLDGTACGSELDDECTNPDTCLAGACVPNHEPLGTPCGDQSDTECDPADTCDGAGACANNILADGTACTDDGLFCTGAETCQAGACEHAGDPCTAPGSVCDASAEQNDACSCANDDACNDGLFCNGTETCGTNGSCEAGTAPCKAGEVCDEDNDICACDSNDDCAEDGLFCNGEEVCAAGACVSAGDPCGKPTPVCDEATDTCLCGTDADCDDGAFCNGAETCNTGGACVSGSNPCANTFGCDDRRDRCIECNDGTDCNDVDNCTLDRCLNGTCESTILPECEDDDDDGVLNASDLCPNSAANAVVDARGCTCADALDTDFDGVTDCDDLCPNTPLDEPAKDDGCACSQLPGDADGDGVADACDRCAGTPTNATVNNDGCAASQLDSDGDGVTDNLDDCDGTLPGTDVGADGCPAPVANDNDNGTDNGNGNANDNTNTNDNGNDNTNGNTNQNDNDNASGNTNDNDNGSGQPVPGDGTSNGGLCGFLGMLNLLFLGLGLVALKMTTKRHRISRA